MKTIITYLRSVPGIYGEGDLKPRYAWGAPSQDDADLRGMAPIPTSVFAAGSAELFSGNCASCHAASGGGLRVVTIRHCLITLQLAHLTLAIY
ncbi:MAG: hypothetical protein H7240_08225 [Glaciimonas sp.]|nr:hypothetical protein [Glaciimonas sp.]